MMAHGFNILFILPNAYFTCIIYKREILIRFILFTLQMKKKSEYKELINELNQLSEDFPATKDRMVEIAKILLTDHYKYLPRNKNKNGENYGV